MVLLLAIAITRLGPVSKFILFTRLTFRGICLFYKTRNLFKSFW